MFTCLEHSVDGRSTATRGGVGGVKVRRLMTVQSIGPYIATAIAATVGDPRNFASGRHFGAWLGLTPKQHSTGGKEKLGGISKRGDSYIRRLLIHGARATVARVRSGQMKNAWLSELLSRRHFNVATVALANKTARVGIVRVNSILPPSARGWARAVLFLLTNCRRARPDSTPKIAYTYLP
jgi:transposase